MDPTTQAGAPALKKILEGGTETTKASETPSAGKETSEAEDSEVEASGAGVSDVDASEVDLAVADTTNLDADTTNVKAVNGHSEEEEVDESKEKLVAETVIETITLEESDGLVTTATVSKVEEQGGMVCADSLDSVRRSMDSLNMCNTPDSLGGEELRSTQEQLEEVLEKAATIQSQVLESIVGVETGDSEAEVINTEMEKVESDMKEAEGNIETIEVEVAEVKVEKKDSENRGIVGLKEVLEKPESNEQKNELIDDVDHSSEKMCIEGVKEDLESPAKVEGDVESIGEINDDSVKPTPAEIIDINGNTGGGATKSKESDEPTQNQDQTEEEEAIREKVSIVKEHNVEVVENAIHSNDESSKKLDTVEEATESVQESRSTEECVEETIQCLAEETEVLAALEVAVSGESSSFDTEEKSSLEVNSSFSATMEEKTSSLEAKSLSVEATFSSVEEKSSIMEEESCSVEEKTLSVEEKALSVEAASFSVEETSLTVEEKSSSAEEKSCSVEAKSSSVEAKSSSVEEKTSSVEATSSSVEEKSSTVETNASSMEAKSSSVEVNSSSVEAATSCLEEKSSSLEEAKSSSSQMIVDLSPAPLAHTLPRQKKSASPGRSSAGKSSVRKLSPTQTVIAGKVIELNSDKAQYLHLSIDQIQELALQQQRGTLFSGGAGGGNGQEEGGEDHHEHEHHCALRQAADKRVPARRSSVKKPVAGVRRNTLQAPDIIKEAVAHSNGHSESNGVRNGRSSSASRHSHPSPSRSSRGPTPEVRRSSNSKSRIREKTLEKEDMLGTKTTEEEVVVVRLKKFSNSEAQQRSVNRLSGIVSRGRSQGESKDGEGESRMSKSWLSHKSRSPSPSLAFGSTSPRRVVRSPSLKKTGGEGVQTASVRRSVSLRAPAAPAIIKRTGSVRRKQGSEVHETKKETEKVKHDEKVESESNEINVNKASASTETLTMSSKEVEESSQTTVGQEATKETATKKVIASSQVKQETKDSSQSIAQRSGTQKSSKSTTNLAKNESSKDASKKVGAGSATAKAIRPRGMKAKEAPPAVAPKPCVAREQEEGVVEESLSAGQAILKFESESAAFAAAASVESLCRNGQEKMEEKMLEEEEGSSAAGEATGMRLV